MPFAFNKINSDDHSATALAKCRELLGNFRNSEHYIDLHQLIETECYSLSEEVLTSRTLRYDKKESFQY